VRDVQLRLRSRGLWPYAVDGYFGTTLTNRITAFQQTQNIPYTALLDKRTWDRLLALTYLAGTFDAARFNAGLNPLLPPVTALDVRCRTGRVLCASKTTRVLTWVVNGRPVAAMWARYGRPGYETREGTFSVLRKYEYVISNLYNVPMPYSMFFSGGQAVHYSSNFARLGYATGSHGCVNIKDYATIRWVFFQVRVGDKVVVHR
jgi:peptidoglycan hydrolase-like protein with peptidoglycan-binding domain